MPRLTSGGGVLSAAMLLVCGFLGFVLVPVTSGCDLGLVEVLRQANFLTGGTLHVASLGAFVGTASIAVVRAKALPRWVCWLGIVQATVAIPSFGRMLGFVWCIAVGTMLAFSRRREPVVEDRSSCSHATIVKILTRDPAPPRAKRKKYPNQRSIRSERSARQ